MIHTSMLFMTKLDDAPWVWGQGDPDATKYSSGLWSKGMPSFFFDTQEEYPGNNIYGNVFENLDVTPHEWNYIKTGSPDMPDPCTYQGEWLGKVINIY
eukprot:CAMPEP_0206235372 /NCGR_PEP_ID=MMETSP0047_2-20121206/13112_1 /ASSEMBLY_ACC=CAM_ASM_000192 /TAXON_ID=195065 /ORGANISM="Chroomonas mesostigmatica_cf, Strain CCMP1168" /LENGTH=97 /DNA_ID=CAMNT_0053659567 /DNA_START=26 /DNA_END=319 /DNA_ORIENTATION=-